MRYSYVLLAWAAVTLNVAAFGDVPVVETTVGGYRIVGKSYAATLDKSGTLTSLVVIDAEFLADDRKIT